MTTTPDTAQTDTARRLAEIRARTEAATPGHWGVHYDGHGTYTIEAQPRAIPGVGSVREGVVATLHGEHDDAQPYHDSGFMARAREDVPFLLDRVAELEGLLKGQVAPDSAKDVHTYFGLSYANYLVLPRTLLQSMPDEWQTKFVALLGEMDEAFQHVPQSEAYDVTPGIERIVSDMTKEELSRSGITKEVLETGDVRFFDENWNDQDPDDRVFIEGADPVPHYNRGRTRVEPRLGGGE